MNRFVAGVAGLALLAGAGLSAAPPATAAATYKACVKKSTGEIRMSTKKCKKGWKRISWTKTGPAGDKGPVGDAGRSNSLGTLVDATGAPIGRVFGTISMGMLGFLVEIDGGMYFYYPNGWLLPMIGVAFTTNTCTGTPYIEASTAERRDEVLTTFGVRSVYRTSAAGVLGTPVVYKPTGAYETVFSQALWRRDETGACVAYGGPPLTGYLIVMQTVSNPPSDRPGPLRVR